MISNPTVYIVTVANLGIATYVSFTKISDKDLSPCTEIDLSRPKVRYRCSVLRYSQRMEIYHLRCFLAVAAESSFTKAADKLHMSLSPLSQRVSKLEAELGAQLFDRSERPVRLTPAGRRLVAPAAAIVRAFDSLPRCVSPAP